MIKSVKHHTGIAPALLAMWVLSLSCTSKKGTPERTSKNEMIPVIYTTTYPMQYFAERIGRGKVLVFCPVPADEATFLRTISAEIVRAYQKADLIVINGAGYEKWIEMVSLPEARVVDTAKPFKDRFVRFERSVTHTHGPAGAHEHKGIDGHTWLDPVNAKVQAGEIARAMKRRFPEHAAAFDLGWKSLAKDLDELHEKLDALAKGYAGRVSAPDSTSGALMRRGGRPVLASHQAYNYIARRYKWNLTSLDLDPEEMPSDDTLAGIKELLKDTPAKYILWEAYPKVEIARRMKDELGLESVEFSPCELLGEEDMRSGLDYLKVMNRNIENARKVFAAGRVSAPD